MEKLDADILLMQEPYSINGHIPGFGNGARVISRGNVGQPPWAAICVRNRGFTVLEISDLCTTHCVCVQISIDGAEIYVVSQYFPPSVDIGVGLAHLDRIVTRLKGRILVIGADANAKSHLWHSGRTDGRGEELEQLIARHDLLVLNEPGQPTTFQSTRGSSNIDVTLASWEAIPLMSTWKVHESGSSSDHRIIETRLDLNNGGTRRPFQKPRYNTRNAKWDKFQRVLMQEKHSLSEAQILCAEDVESVAEHFERVLTSACDAAIPLRKWHNRSKPWWTGELTELKRASHRARRKFQMTRDPTTRGIYEEEWKTLRRVYKKKVANVKNSTWRQFVTKKGNDEPWGVATKAALGKLRSEEAVSSLVLADGEQTESWRSTAEALLRALVPDDEVREETPEQMWIRNETAVQPDTEAAPPFLEEELCAAVTRLRRGKCPGPDRVEVEVIQRSWGCLREELLKLCNGCLDLGVFPTRWKVGNIIAIPKGPDRDRSSPKSYRPICLLSMVGKLLERLMAVRLAPLLLDHRLSSDRQYGFRPGKSTEDAIVKLREVVASKVEESYVLAIALDISGAFDNVWWPNVLYELKRRNCPRNLYGLVDSYFSERSVQIMGKQESVSKSVTKGCPQGSILGPSFWNLVFDDLLAVLSSEELECEPIAYADDVLVIVSGNSREALRVRGQAAVTAVSEWCGRKKLQLSAEKTEMLLVKGDLDIRRPPTIRLNGRGIKMQPVIKYLGVHLETGLKMDTHVRKVSEKCLNLFNALARIAKANWGLGYGALYTLYRGLYVPITTYAAAAWGDLLRVKSRTALVRSQRLALLRVTKAYSTTSTDALPIIAGVVPIDLLLEERSKIYKIRKGPNPSKEEEQQAREATMDAWQQRWRTSSKGRTTFEFFNDVRQRVRSTCIQPDYYVTQFLSGHGNFRWKLNTFALSNSALCDCGAAETSTHLIYQCCLNELARTVMREALWKKGHGWPIAESELVGKTTFRIFRDFAHATLKAKERSTSPVEEDQPPQQQGHQGRPG